MASSSSRLLLSYRYNLQRQYPHPHPHHPQHPAWSLSTILRWLESRQLSCEQLVRYCHATAVAGEAVWHLGAFSRLASWDDLQGAAFQADDRRRRGAPKSRLDGIPSSLKANLAAASYPLTAGSRILGHAATTSTTSTSITTPTPAVGYNADLVQHLVDDCGAICIGVTNMDEFGMGSLGTHTAKRPQRPSGIVQDSEDHARRHHDDTRECRMPATKNPLAFVPNLSKEEEKELLLNPVSLLDILQQDPETIHQLHSEILSSLVQQPQQHAHHPTLRNSGGGGGPHHHHYSAGGSSCGAAASVAHGSSLVALASDTGGSIRLPAAWCRIAGLKPGYGRHSRHGLVAYASSLDTVGFLTPTARCAATVLREVTALATTQTPASSSSLRLLPRDSNSYYYSTPTLPCDNINNHDNHDNHDLASLQGIRIGIPSAFCVQECPTWVRDVWARGATALQKAGATVVTLSDDVVAPQVVQQSLAAYYVLASAEASSNLARYDGFRYGLSAPTTTTTATTTMATTSSSDDVDDENDNDTNYTALQRQYAATRTQGFGPEVIRRILCGTAVLSSDKFHTHYEAAAKIRALVTRQLQDAVTHHADYLLIPSVLFPPPRLDQDDAGVVDGTEMFANDILTVPISLSGLAAVNVTVPMSMSPLSASQSTSAGLLDRVSGLQLVGRRLEEERLLAVAQHLDGSNNTSSIIQ